MQSQEGMKKTWHIQIRTSKCPSGSICPNDGVIQAAIRENHRLGGL